MALSLQAANSKDHQFKKVGLLVPHYTISWEAQQDLNRIWVFCLGVTNERAADRQLSRLYDRFQLLAEFPYLGMAWPDYAPGIRRHHVPNTPFVALYYPREGHIEIARVVHGSQDISAILD